MGTDWTQEKIEKVTPGEIRTLAKNARALGAGAIADLCDEVLRTKLKAGVSRASAPGKQREPRKLVSRKKAMEMSGVTLRNPRWSCGALRASDGMAVLTIWHDEIGETPTGNVTRLWGPNIDGSRPWADKPGGREREEQCKVAAAMGQGEGVVIYGERRGRDLPLDQASKVTGADPHRVIRFRVEMRGDDYWAIWDRTSVVGMEAEGATPEEAAGRGFKTGEG